jgi:hypothetical protein
MNEAEAASAADRRKFLAACGKFAVVTPPAITLLLSTSLNSTAIAHSGDVGTTTGTRADIAGKTTTIDNPRQED